MAKLMPTQERVMKWIDGGWILYQYTGNGVTVNNTWICNSDTMKVLERLELVETGSIGRVKTWKRNSAKGKIGDAEN